MDIINKGGYTLLIIVSCSVIALTIIIERWRFYRRIEREEKEVMRQVRQALTGQEIAAAALTVGHDETFLAEVFKEAMENCRRGEQPEITIDDRMAEIAPQLEQYLYILATIATIAPLLGLLGTVLGMIKTFHAASLSGLGDPHKLAEGISEALYNTAAGLLVTVPSVIAHNHFRNWAETLLHLLERRTREITRLVARRGEMLCR
ncbi:MAG TPA: MotA/TolQ/ExbB proton channel family protein [Methylomusa anaerophila]|uniref:Biopolymer transport protein ExbB n=1 Tax=Methylomusa anaerophila TaxID=1930071 RepID=A0A348ALM6_9FIRM|nr:MotA/TolQ/ExbB proton channel family protein [Methylomusa anaerophila]BBB91974.1 biopolymer transport protein ExbB [Methylomusa anaerophila]HML88013.1 MotA/TolQ/ExbB proton channel family protein [Methylomusa anaerophila]